MGTKKQATKVGENPVSRGRHEKPMPCLRATHSVKTEKVTSTFRDNVKRKKKKGDGIRL